MNYIGPLFGKHGRQYIPLTMTSEEVDAICDDRDRLREMLERCEMWLSTAPDGRAMQLACQEVITKSKEVTP